VTAAATVVDIVDIVENTSVPVIITTSTITINTATTATGRLSLKQFAAHVSSIIDTQYEADVEEDCTKGEGQCEEQRQGQEPTPSRFGLKSLVTLTFGLFLVAFILYQVALRQPKVNGAFDPHCFDVYT